jgi:acetyl-CoA carboxylase alpha subunit
MERELDFEKPVLEIEKTIEKLRHRDAHGKGENREKIEALENQLAEARRLAYRAGRPASPSARSARLHRSSFLRLC